MNERNLRLNVGAGEAVIVDRSDVEVTAIAGTREIDLRHAFRGDAGIERIELADELR